MAPQERKTGSPPSSKDTLLATEIQLDPSRFLASLVQAASTLPQGTNFFRLSENFLHPSDFTSCLEAPTGTIAFKKSALTASDRSRGYRIDVAHPLIIDHLHLDVSYLTISLNPRAKFQEATFHCPSLPHQSRLDAQIDFRHRANATCLFSVIKDLLIFSVKYGGDERQVKPLKVENFSPAQTAIVFKEGLVPPINLNLLISHALFLPDLLTRQKLILPTLTFNPEERHFDTFSGTRTFLSLSSRHPTIAVGETLRGVAITETKSGTPDRPYAVTATIQKLKVDPREKGTTVWAAINVFDGKQTKIFPTASFVVPEAPSSLAASPADLLGHAFKKISPKL